VRLSVNTVARDCRDIARHVHETARTEDDETFVAGDHPAAGDRLVDVERHRGSGRQHGPGRS
jgi:hypothetical protein